MGWEAKKTAKNIYSNSFNAHSAPRVNECGKQLEKLLAVHFGLQIKCPYEAATTTTTHQIQMYLWNVHRLHTHTYTLWHACSITSTLNHLWISITAYLLRFRYHLITSMFWDKIIELESTVWCRVVVVVCCHFQWCRCAFVGPTLDKRVTKKNAHFEMAEKGEWEFEHLKQREMERESK